MARELEDKENEHIGLHQLAMVYREMGDFEKALHLIEEEDQLIQQYFQNDYLKLSVNNYEQGYLRLKCHRTQDALKYMTLSLKQALLTDDFVAQACAYRGLGEIYLALDDVKLAEKHLLKASEAFEQAGDDLGQKDIQSLLADLAD